METLVIGILAITGAMLVLGIIISIGLTEEEGRIFGFGLLCFGAPIIILAIQIPSPKSYGKKMLHHQYTIEYTNRVNSQNQVVSRDTTVVWKK